MRNEKLEVGKDVTKSFRFLRCFDSLSLAQHDNTKSYFSRNKKGEVAF